MRPRHDPGRARRREVAPDPGVPRGSPGRVHRRARPVPLLRRRHHVLAGRGDAHRRRRHPRRGRPRRDPLEDRGAPRRHERSRDRLGTARRVPRTGGGDGVTRGDALGDPQALRGPRRRATARRRVRGHPLGGAGPARSDRARRRVDARRADPPGVPGAPGAAGRPAGLGRAGNGHDAPPRTALPGRIRPADRRAARSVGRTRDRGGACDGGGRGQPAVRRADGRDADRRRPGPAGGGRMGRHRRPVEPDRAADDRRTAPGEAGSTHPRGAAGDRTRLRRGPRLPLGKRHRAVERPRTRAMSAGT